MFMRSIQQIISANNVFTNRIRAHSAAIHSSTSEDALLKLSDSCVNKLKNMIEDSHSFLRLSVEGGGCSGFQYKFDIDHKVAEDDRIFERDGVKVVTDETSLEYVKGSTIDYHSELIRSAFRVVSNPNAELGCSCGASFSIKLD